MPCPCAMIVKRARRVSSTAAEIWATEYWAHPGFVPGVMQPPVDMI